MLAENIVPKIINVGTKYSKNFLMETEKSV